MEAQPEQMVWNRTRGTCRCGTISSGRPTAGSRSIARRSRDLPASGVSFLQAEAYARWLTRAGRASGRPCKLAIPTDLEWEKAARGADGRAYAYGNVFHALWQKSGRSSLRMAPDESPQLSRR